MKYIFREERSNGNLTVQEVLAYCQPKDCVGRKCKYCNGAVRAKVPGNAILLEDSGWIGPSSHQTRLRVYQNVRQILPFKTGDNALTLWPKQPKG